MGLMDWIITALLFAAIIFMAGYMKRFTRSVADFLAANRCAGRYLLCISSGIAASGVVGVIGCFQIVYANGFAGQWWNWLLMPIHFILPLSGWVVYRYRQTRAMTLAQFFEIRYSRRFRVFAGILGFFSGAVNFGIWPAIGASFFMQYCGLPPKIGLISTYYIVLFVLLALSYYFTFTGGQISVLLADFFQGMFMNVVMVAILIALLLYFNLSDVFKTLALSPPGHSLVNPLDIKDADGYSIWFFLINVATGIYGYKCWQGDSGFTSAARTPHEAKMAGVLSPYRYWGFLVSMTFLPLCAYAFMHNPAYQERAAGVQQLLNAIQDPETRRQMVTPMAMRQFIPQGIIGCFAAAMFAAFVASVSSQMHSWGTIFIQDVLLPLRKEALSPERHIRWLRLSILGVAVFSFLWSCMFRQTQRMQLFFMVTGVIFLGGAGAVLVGGLYWKRGTTVAAWLSMITGAAVAIAGVILDQIWVNAYNINFPIDFKWVTVIGMASASAVYVLVSLMDRGEDFNMDRMLHRGAYRAAGETIHEDDQKFNLRRIFGFTHEFTRGDKIIYGYVIGFMWVVFFLAFTVTMVSIVSPLSNFTWARIQYYSFIYMVVMSFVIAVWLTIGGFKDLSRMLRDLKTVNRNNLDDGRVVDHKNLDETVDKVYTCEEIKS